MMVICLFEILNIISDSIKIKTIKYRSIDFNAIKFKRKLNCDLICLGFLRFNCINKKIYNKSFNSIFKDNFRLIALDFVKLF